MNDAQHAFWQRYLRDLADRLGLKDWRIDLERDQPADDRHGASCSAYPGQQRVAIRLSRTFLDTYSPAEQRQAALHEVLHPHFERTDDPLWVAIDNGHGDTALLRLIRDLQRNEREYVIDNLATAIAPLLPLPEGAP
jgi:hypothetical protein